MAATDDLLTAREVQEILKIDRTTVYRMLKDGRLGGVKVGQQWRFPHRAVDALLGGARPLAQDAPPGEGLPLPVHCIQAIQDLFADIAGVAAITLAPDGQPLTRPSGAHALRAALTPAVNGGQGCVRAPVTLDGRVVATLVAGPAANERARAQLAGWARSAARTYAAIGRERAAVAARLRAIAALTEMGGS
jgi:excisionase family DNA binding protein